MVSVVIVAASVFSGLLFLVCAWLTRACYWRTAAALLGGLAAAGFRYGVDMAAFHFDWWSFGDAANAPVITYVPIMFWFGGALGLVGWRMIRNWGAAGEISFFLGFVLLGMARDLVLTLGSGALNFGAGALPLAIAAATWLIMAILVQYLMQLLVGPVDLDALEPERLPQIEDGQTLGWLNESTVERRPFARQT